MATPNPPETVTIYVIENDVNKKVYVGKTKYSIELRFASHIKESRQPYETYRPICRAIRKHGASKFHIRVLDVVHRSKADDCERFWIQLFNCYGRNGYNATTGGDGQWESLPPSEEARRLMGEASKKRWKGMSAEDRKAWSVAASKRWKQATKEEQSEWIASRVQGNKKRWAAYLSDERRECIEILNAAFNPSKVKGLVRPKTPCAKCGYMVTDGRMATHAASTRCKYIQARKHKEATRGVGLVPFFKVECTLCHALVSTSQVKNHSYSQRCNKRRARLAKLKGV